MVSETNNTPGNYAYYTYTYNEKGNVKAIVRHPVAANPYWNDSVAVGNMGTVSYFDNHVLSTVYDEGFIGFFPGAADISLDTLHAIYSYFFYYDSKNRLNKVSFIFSDSRGHAEDLIIAYNDQDNVINLHYEVITGVRGAVDIPVSGFDDHPTPLSGIPYWAFIMHRPWDNYDPEPIITALSKNNPLGFVDGEWTRKIAYTYNEQGLPVKRTSTTTVEGKTSTFTETYEYVCQ